jgi:hypothetical protein
MAARCWVILLAPAVCVTYDLRPALRTARCGIDVFHSSRDRAILGLGMRIVGTAEGGCRTAAGQYSFTPVLAGPADPALYGKLRQHPWAPAVQWSGNDGGHYGCIQVGYLGRTSYPSWPAAESRGAPAGSRPGGRGDTHLDLRATASVPLEFAPGPTPTKKGRTGKLPEAQDKPKERKTRRPRGG